MLQLPPLTRHCEIILAESASLATLGELLAVAEEVNAAQLRRWCVALAVRSLPDDLAVAALAGAADIVPELADEQTKHKRSA